MEIIVSVFSALVAMSCLIAVIRSDITDSKRAVRQDRQIGVRES
jgi:hypothetical protein